MGRETSFLVGDQLESLRGTPFSAISLDLWISLKKTPCLRLCLYPWCCALDLINNRAVPYISAEACYIAMLFVILSRATPPMQTTAGLKDLSTMVSTMTKQEFLGEILIMDIFQGNS